MRKKIVAGNWKMNLLAEEARSLAAGIAGYIGAHPLAAHKEVILAPPFPYIESVAAIVRHVPGLRVSAQNCHQKTGGAFTGEVAADMIRSVGADCVILGHSERRAIFMESDALIKAKVDGALNAGLQPVFCCGETEAERDAGRHMELVGSQVEAALFHLSHEQAAKCIIAYEPVWAIGTGRTASPEQAQEMHGLIRNIIASRFGTGTAGDMTILYGGSCKPDNAVQIFSQPDVDGGLIGGASLKADDFIAIINAL